MSFLIKLLIIITIIIIIIIVGFIDFISVRVTNNIRLYAVHLGNIHSCNEKHFSQNMKSSPTLFSTFVQSHCCPLSYNYYLFIIMNFIDKTADSYNTWKNSLPDE